MNVSSTNGRLLAILAGMAFTAGGLTILLGNALTRPLDWASYQWLTILTVFGTIAAGHLMADAGRARHLFAATGFLALFLAGTGLVVYSSVGRQVEAAGATMLSAEDTNAKIIEKQADLAKAKKRFDEATQYGDDEMKGETCGRRCKDWRQRAKEVQALITQLEGEIAALGPQKPVNAQDSAMADIASLIGFDNKAKTIGVLTLVIPFLKTLFFEIGSIVSLGFAFRQSPIAKVAEPSISDLEEIRDRFFAVEAEPDPVPPKPRKKLKKPENVVAFPVKHPVVQALERNGGSVASNRQLATLMGVSAGESSKRVQEVAEALVCRKVGKELQISLKRSA